MSQKMRVWFWQVQEGETFTSNRTTRRFVGVKIHPIQNFAAVMTFYDDQTVLGPESGSLISVDNHLIVEVER